MPPPEKYVLTYDLQRAGASRYAPFNFRRANPGDTHVVGKYTCDWRLPNDAEEFEYLYGTDDLDAFIEQYAEERPRDFNLTKNDNLDDLFYGEIVIQLKRVFHQPTAAQERLLVSPWLPSQIVSCYMRAIVAQADSRFCPVEHRSPWIMAAYFKTNSYGIVSDVFHPKWAHDPEWHDDYMSLVVPREKVYNILQQGVNTVYNRAVPDLKLQMETWLSQLQKVFPMDRGWRRDAIYRDINPYRPQDRARVFPIPVIPTVSHRPDSPPSKTPRADLWRRDLDPSKLWTVRATLTRRRSFSDAQHGKIWPHRDWNDLVFDNPRKVQHIYDSRLESAKDFQQPIDELRGRLYNSASVFRGA